MVIKIINQYLFPFFFNTPVLSHNKKTAAAT
jgi:hypothetical protein